MEHPSRTLVNSCVCTMRMRVIRRKNPRPNYYGYPREGALDLGKEAVSEKTPQIFRPSSPTEFVTAFSERTDAPEVRCDLTDTHTHTHRHDDYRNPRACAPRVNDKLHMKILYNCIYSTSKMMLIAKPQPDSAAITFECTDYHGA